jgi:LysM repeat protein
MSFCIISSGYNNVKKSLKIPKSNQNPYIEEEQTTQWPKEKGQKDKQRSTKHTHKTKDRITRTPLKTGGVLRCSGRVGSSCSTIDTRRVNLVANPVIRHEWGKDREDSNFSGNSAYVLYNCTTKSCDQQDALNNCTTSVLRASICIIYYTTESRDLEDQIHITI